MGLEHWLTDRAAGFPDPQSSPERVPKQMCREPRLLRQPDLA